MDTNPKIPQVGDVSRLRIDFKKILISSENETQARAMAKSFGTLPNGHGADDALLPRLCINCPITRKGRNDYVRTMHGHSAVRT